MIWSRVISINETTTSRCVKPFSLKKPDRDAAADAAGADRAAAGVAHSPLEQRAAQKLSCHRQLADERLARLDDLVSRHLDK